MPTVFFTCLQMSRKDTPLTYITESGTVGDAQIDHFFVRVKYNVADPVAGLIKLNSGLVTLNSGLVK